MLILLHLKLIFNPRLIRIALDYQMGSEVWPANDPKFSVRKAAKTEAGRNLPRILQSVLTRYISLLKPLQYPQGSAVGQGHVL